MVDVERTRIVTVSDADEEVRAAVRAVVDAARAGTPLERIAVLYAGPEPYARLRPRAAVGGRHRPSTGRRSPLTARRRPARTLLGLLGPSRGRLPPRRRVRLAGRRPPAHRHGRCVPVIRLGAPVSRRRASWQAAPTGTACSTTWPPTATPRRRRPRAIPTRPNGGPIGSRPGRGPRPCAARVRAGPHRRSGRGGRSAAAVGRSMPRGPAATSHDLLGRERRRAGWPLAEQKSGRAGRAGPRPPGRPRRRRGPRRPRRLRPDPRARARGRPRPGRPHGRGRPRRAGRMGVGLDLDLVVVLGLAEGPSPPPHGTTRCCPTTSARPPAASCALRSSPSSASTATARRPGRRVAPPAVRAPGRSPPQQRAGAVALGARDRECAGRERRGTRRPARRGHRPDLARSRRLVRRRPPRRRASRPPRRSTGCGPCCSAGPSPHGATLGRRRWRPRAEVVVAAPQRTASPASTATWPASTSPRRPSARCLGHPAGGVGRRARSPISCETPRRRARWRTPRTGSSISPLDRGSLVHEVLERFVAERRRPASPAARTDAPWSESDAEPAARDRARRLRPLRGHGLTGRPIFWQPDRRRIMADLARFLALDSEHRRDHGTRPLAAELALRVPGRRRRRGPAGLADGRRSAFRGKADRLDVADDGTLQVVDYKTGRADDYTRPQRGRPRSRRDRGSSSPSTALAARRERPAPRGAGPRRVLVHLVARAVQADRLPVTPEVLAPRGETLAAIVDGHRGRGVPQLPDGDQHDPVRRVPVLRPRRPRRGRPRRPVERKRGDPPGRVLGPGRALARTPRTGRRSGSGD